MLRSLKRRAVRDDLRLAFVEGERLVAEALQVSRADLASRADHSDRAGIASSANLASRLGHAEALQEGHAGHANRAPRAVQAAGEGFVRRLCVSASYSRGPAFEAFAREAARSLAPVDIVADSFFASMCDTEAPQGTLAVIEFFDVGMEELLSRLAMQRRLQPGWRMRALALDCVQDPGNVGGMIRTAAAAGFSAVVLGEGCADLYAPKTLRAAMGAAFRIPIVREPSLPSAIEELKRLGARAYAAAPRGAPSLFEADLSRQDFCLVVGNEGAGVGAGALALCDGALSLPMPGGVESLNVGVAAGIIIYETLRQEAQARRFDEANAASAPQRMKGGT